ncbi:beta-microseminoprotein-like [Discoglossus pictus]
MKHLVALLFAAAILVSVCNAFCLTQLPEALTDDTEPLQGCMFDGELHKFGSRWRTPECMRCDCSSEGSVHCCSLTFTAHYDKNECEEIINKRTCTQVVVQKKNRALRCNKVEMVG